MARRTAYSATALSRAASGEQLPSLEVTLAYAAACGARAEEWQEHWHQAKAEATRLPAEPADAPAAPYRGLGRFEPADQDQFFGRGRLTDELVELACAQRVTVVWGASGSGKSSLLRAGLIPPLQRVDDAAPRPAAIRILTPGARPFEEHQKRCVPAVGAGDTWLVVDQFEEAFTICQDAAQRRAFIDLLMRARDAGSGLRVVLGVRADFYTRCLEHEGLAAVLAKASLPVVPMTSAELREIIVKPAAATGLIVERALTARLIEQTGGRPGSLPLLSHVLLETWRRRQGRTLTTEAYEAAGGLHGAIAQSAEALYTQLSTDQAELARLLLLRLITPGEGAQDTRRSALRGELDLTETPAHVDQVLDQLARARLLTLDDDTVDLAHEALITAWPRLRAWTQESREHLRCHRQLTEAARRWRELDDDAGALYRGALLATAEEHFPQAHGHPELTALERAFLTASTTASDQEQRATARTTRRLRHFTAALSVLLVLAMAAGLLAWEQSRRSERESDRALDARRVAQSQQLAAQSAALLDEDPDLASLLAVQAHRTSPTPESAASLYSAYGLPLRHRLTGHTGWVRALAFGHKGRTLVSITEDRTARVWDTATGKSLSVIRGYADGAHAMTLSPDGRTLAIAAGDDNNMVWLTDVATGKVRHVFGRVESSIEFAFTPDGRTLAMGTEDGVRLWDVADSKARGTLTDRRIKAAQELALSPDGRTLAAAGADGGVGLWDVATGKPRAMLTGRFRSADALAFSPDGHTLATNGSDGRVWLWNTASGDLRRVLTGGADVLAFSPDGRMLVTGGGSAVRLWDVPTGKKRATLTGHTGGTNAVMFSPDGHTLATGSDDKTVRLWDVHAGATRATTTHHTGTLYAMALSPDRRTLAMAGPDHTVRLRDAVRGSPLLSLTGHTRDIEWVVFSPDGKNLATGSVDSTVRLWDVRTGKNRRVLPGDPASAVAFSPDGRTLASTDINGHVQMWNTTTGEKWTIRYPLTEAMAFSPDGRTLATAGDDDAVRLRDATTGKTHTTLRGHNSSVESMVFSPDGHTLAIDSDDSTVRLWDVATGEARKAIARHSDSASAVAFTPGGRALAATSGTDTSVRLWDVETGNTYTTFTGHTEDVSTIMFSTDASTLVTLGDDKTVRLWKVDVPTPARSIRKICRLIHRDLTPLERSTYLPKGPARPVCSP
ncbi:WD40 repeat domain-containing protein [Streptomyces sp. AN091965]|uniref:WD40 repeat domain-containing protein n=1 Tax=Streptomyces sp. AN091965 TaxID=2927803 RepID=UPI001F61DE13|nr:WD40 repeat domain-containing protein [Streptomyces sp. AN091965]MCI3935109.1 WD40 repeat domain-containing protein [Streptomyces sp. AN091965]